MPAGPFQTIVQNDKQGLSPFGNTTQGDFELSYRATNSPAFVFPGGGLIMRVSNPAGEFATDNTCTFDLRGGDSSDPSGFVVERHLRDPDGTPPWSETDPAHVAGFQLTFNRTCARRPANIVGTAGDHSLQGTPGPDVISAGEGNDTVRGSAGNDVICGDESRDTLIGGPGRDLLLGGQGHDRLLGGKGKDTCKGGGGALDRAKSCEKQRSI